MITSLEKMPQGAIPNLDQSSQVAKSEFMTVFSAKGLQGTTFEKVLNFNTEEDYELTGGERQFNVREIEVYEVIPQ